MENIEIKTKWTTVDVHDSVATALSACTPDNAFTVIVTDKDEYKGLFTPDLIKKKRFDATEFKVGQLTQVVKLSQPESVEEAISHALKTHSYVVPVGSDTLEGVIDIRDALQELQGVVSDAQGITEVIDAKTRVDTFLEMKIPFALVADDAIIGAVWSWDIKKRIFETPRESRGGHKAKIETKGFTSERDTVFALPIENFMVDIQVAEPETNFSDVKVAEVPAVLVEDTIISVFDMLETTQVNETRPAIEFVGIRDEVLKLEFESEWSKLQRKFGSKFKEPMMLKVHMKEYHKEGTQAKVSLNLHVSIAQTVISSSSTDWDIQAATKDAFAALEVNLSKR